MINLRARMNFAGLVMILLLIGSGEGPVAKPATQSLKIEITSHGYKHQNVKLRRGVPSRVTFVRTTDATCVKEIVLPDFNIRRALPLNRPVVITFTPKRKGTFTFVCGMNMMSGQLTVNK